MLSGQTKSKGANIQSRISPNSERSVSETDEVALFALRSLKAVSKAADGGDLYATRLDFFAQSMNIDLDCVMADLFSPATKVIDELILADQTPHATKQYFKKPYFTG